MSPDRFTRRGPACYGIEANVGVGLRGHGRHVIVVPRAHADADGPPPAAFRMPLLPARLVEDKVRLLRRLATGGRLGLWALYIDTRPPHGWHAYLPPQWCGTRGVRANLAYPRVPVPGPPLRLAGTLQSAPPPASADELASNLPPFDGVHLFFHPHANWLVLTAYLAISGEPYLVTPAHVLHEPDDPDLASLSARLWGDS